MRFDETEISLIKFLVMTTQHSRRELSQLIQKGKVSVEGNIITSLNYQVNPIKHTIKLNDIKIQSKLKRVYYKYYKPKGIISTTDDPKNRKCLGPVLAALPQPVFPIGRLDRQSSGLLLFTNDGDFAQQILHPSFSIPKDYTVTVDGPITKAMIQHIQAGVILEDGPILCDAFNLLSKTQCFIRISSGRNRIIRRLMSFFGREVTTLKRTSIGPIRLDKLAKGEHELISTNLIQGWQNQLQTKRQNKDENDQ